MKNFYLLVVILSIFSCNKQKFKSNNGSVRDSLSEVSEKGANTPSSTTPSTQAPNIDPKDLITKEFEIKSISKGVSSVDITWIVDESASMRQEVETVRDNLSSFQKSVTQFSDAKNMRKRFLMVGNDFPELKTKNDCCAIPEN